MIDLGQFAFAASILVGLINGLKLAVVQRNWQSFALFASTVVVGTILGFAHWFGLPSAEVGFALGVATSGVYEIAQRIGGQ